jgi:CheY-like chemotaxis protein
VFTVKLPLMIIRRPTGHLATEPEGRHPGGSSSVPFKAPASLQGLKVLVVEDEPDARELLKTILQQCQAEVKTCDSTAEALRAVEEYKPDILISDIGMPEENGYALIEKVRALEPERGGRTPAVALTAYARVEDRMRALLAGFNIHVPKPIEPAELVVVIASLIERSRKL